MFPVQHLAAKRRFDRLHLDMTGPQPRQVPDGLPLPQDALSINAAAATSTDTALEPGADALYTAASVAATALAASGAQVAAADAAAANAAAVALAHGESAVGLPLLSHQPSKHLVTSALQVLCKRREMHINESWPSHLVGDSVSCERAPATVRGAYPPHFEHGSRCAASCCFR
jgi:hypothetical protein